MRIEESKYITVPAGTYYIQASFHCTPSGKAVMAEMQRVINKLVEDMEKQLEILPKDYEYRGLSQVLSEDDYKPLNVKSPWPTRQAYLNRTFPTQIDTTMPLTEVRLGDVRITNLEAPAGHSKPKCDCGALKCKTTHATWCSVYEK